MFRVAAHGEPMVSKVLGGLCGKGGGGLGARKEQLLLRVDNCNRSCSDGGRLGRRTALGH
eukprot:11115470-Alexandrium_andersonii.AAC.1